MSPVPFLKPGFSRPRTFHTCVHGRVCWKRVRAGAALVSRWFWQSAVLFLGGQLFPSGGPH